MKKWKKVLAVMSVAVVCAAGVPMTGLQTVLPEGTLTASAAANYGDLTYEYSEDGTIMITDCNTSATEVEIPASIDGAAVTSIGDSAFEDCDSLISITIPDSVTSIGDSAFYCCTNLTSITIPNSVTSIGDWAFYDCTSLTSITIPDGVPSIGVLAFFDCDSLTSITIPDSVTSIGDRAFSDCDSLTEIIISEGNASYSSIDGVLFDRAQTRLIYYPMGKLQSSYVIPDGVTEIGSNAFKNCDKLTEVTIPDSVTSIGIIAFGSCTSLTSITIPDSVTIIEHLAFSDCDSLTEIIISEGNTSYSSIDGVLFNRAQTRLIHHPMGKLQSSYVIPDGVTEIGNNAFENCDKLTKITIPDSVTSIESNAFYDCDGLTSITIPNSVTSIGHLAIADCNSLTEATISDSVTSIEDWAFHWCINLTDVYYTGTQEQWNEISVGSDNEDLLNATIHLNATINEIQTGDLDGDGEITIQDAFQTLIAYANASAGIDDGLTDAQRTAADVDGDGSITIQDAFKILIYYATESAGGIPSWD